jgi:hypothetical protein
MRVFRRNRFWPALAIAFGAALVITTAASADGLVHFSGSAAIGPGDLTPGRTFSKFYYDSEGNISSVAIRMLGEKVRATNLDVTCDPAGSEACEALVGATLSEVHASDEVLSNVSYIPAQFTGFGVDAIAGALNGKLAGLLTVMKPGQEGKLTGGLTMTINGSATMICVVLTSAGPAPVLLSACEDKDGVTGPDGGGMLLPVIFSVHDEGSFILGPGTGVFEGIEGAWGSVAADIAATPYSIVGSVTISNAVLSTE